MLLFSLKKIFFYSNQHGGKYFHMNQYLQPVLDGLWGWIWTGPQLRWPYVLKLRHRSECNRVVYFIPPPKQIGIC